MNRKEKLSMLRRDFIVEKAEILFYEHGYFNVTMDDIARDSQYAKKTLYNYINSKEEIFLYVYIRGLQKRVLYLKKKMDDSKNGFENLKIFGNAYFEFYRKNPGILHHQLIGDNTDLNFSGVDEIKINELNEWQKKGNCLVTDSIRKGLNDGSVKKDINYNFWFPHFIYTLRFSIAKSVFGMVPDLNMNKIKDNEAWYKWVLKQVLTEIES